LLGFSTVIYVSTAAVEICAAVVARGFSLTNEHNIISRQGNHLDAHYEIIVNKIANLKENKPKLFT
jgi:hypothetical protein